MSTAILADGLSKSFLVPQVRSTAAADPRREPAGRRDRFYALRDVSFSVPRGQSLGIIGANGSGKTTLLKMLARVMTPSSGRVGIEGRVGALLEVGAGFHPDLTGEENVRLHGALLGLRRLEISRQLSEIIALAELERFMDMPVRHYSSGMVVRLGFATALQLRPEILLLDETLSVGDAVFQRKAALQIAQMRASGVNLVIVSHNIGQILAFSDRVIWLDRGRIALDGPPHEVLARYREQMGATSLGGARIFSQFIGHANSMRLRDSAGHFGLEGGDWKGPSEIETGSPLEIEVNFTCAGMTETPDLLLEVWFMREENHRETAFSRFDLRGVPPGKLRLHWDALPLGRGRYDTTITLRRADERDPGLVEARFALPRPLVIPTAPPKHFNVAAELPARWG